MIAEKSLTSLGTIETPAPTSATTQNQTSPKPRALISRQIDIWLIGGASLLVWALFQIAQAYRDNYAVHQHFDKAGSLAVSLSLLINYPHFMASYRIAYTRGFRFILKHWFQLLFVPFALFGLFTMSYFTYSDPSPLPPIYNPWQLRAGEGLASLLIALMFLTVGWHYIKQTFGCMMVYGAFDGYRISTWQRRALLTLLYTLMIANFIGGNTGATGKSYFYGVPIMFYGFPPEFHLVTLAVFWILLSFFAYGVVWRNWTKQKKLPSLGFLVPLVALVIWWVPTFAHKEFLLFVPLFHSLQYLPFAYRYELGRNQWLKKPSWVGSFQVLSVILAGYLAFEFIPYAAQGTLVNEDMKKALFFVVAASVFINVHHYFIDNVIWKFNQPEIQRYLLGKEDETRTVA